MLTDSAIKKAVREGGSRILSDGSGRGSGRLILSIRPGIRPEWYAQQWTAGRRRTRKLGTYPELSLLEARDRFREEVLPAILSGESIKIPKRKEGTVGELFEAYVESLRSEGKRSVKDAKKNLPRFARFVGEDRPASSITTSDVVAFLRPVYARGRRSMADHLRSYIRAAYGWAIRFQNDYRSPAASLRFDLKANPAAEIPTEPKVAGTRWLRPDELRRFWDWLERGGDPVPGKQATTRSNLVALRLILASGQRVEEIAGLRSEWIDYRSGILELPTTKNGRPHAIPITTTIGELLREVDRGEGFVFPSYVDSGRPVHNQTLLRIVMRYHDLNPGEEWFTPRDFRRTWKTLAGEAGISKADRDLIQNHARRDVSSVYYDRYEYLREKRSALEVWDAFLRRELFK